MCYYCTVLMTILYWQIFINSLFCNQQSGQEHDYLSYGRFAFADRRHLMCLCV